MSSVIAVPIISNANNPNIILHGPFKLERSILDTIPTKEKIINNTPKCFATGEVDLCTASILTCLTQDYLCKHDPKFKNQNCSDLSDENTISPFGFTSWEVKDPEYRGAATPDAYSTIPLDKITKGSVGALALANSIYTDFSFYTNDCYPFDQFINNITKLFSNDPTEGLMKTFIAKLTNTYSKLKYKYTTTEGTICLDCLKNMTETETDVYFSTLNLENSKKNIEILRAVIKLPLESSLFELLFGSRCERKKFNVKKPEINYFPNNKDTTEITDEKLLSSIKENVDNSNMTALRNICLKEENNICIEKHTVAISGYREYDGITYLQIKQNAGKELDKKLEWVEATYLIKNLVRTSQKQYEMGTLTWLSNK